MDYIRFLHYTIMNLIENKTTEISRNRTTRISKTNFGKETFSEK